DRTVRARSPSTNPLVKRKGSGGLVGRMGVGDTFLSTAHPQRRTWWAMDGAVDVHGFGVDNGLNLMNVPFTSRKSGEKHRLFKRREPTSRMMGKRLVRGV